MRRTILTMAVLAALMGVQAKADEAADSAAWQKADNEAQAIVLAHEQRELYLKNELAKAHDADVQIIGNHITMRLPDGWKLRHLDAFARQVGYFALLMDSGQAEKTGSAPMYLYFHVRVENADGRIGEAIASRSDCPQTPEGLLAAFTQANNEAKAEDQSLQKKVRR